MIDAALIKNCADTSLKPAIVEQFIAAAGSVDPLAITVTSGSRVVLVPQPKTAEDAMVLAKRYVGHAVVRVGITQYPAGLGLQDKSELSADLVDACKNLKMGTALFAKVYRIVTKWYGNPRPEAFEDTVIAYKSGYFEGRSVFREPDPGDVEVATPKAANDETGNVDPAELTTEPTGENSETSIVDPNNAGIRIDLSSIGR